MHRMLLATCLLSLLVGCTDEQAAQLAADNQAIAEALEDHRQARISFVPTKKGADQNGDLSLQDYRHAKRLELIGQPSKAKIVARGTLAQQIATRRMLGDAHAATAHHIAEKSMTDWSLLAGRSTAMLAQLSRIAAAAGRVQIFSRSEASLLSKLYDQQIELNRRLGQHRSGIQALGGQIVDSRRRSKSHEGERERNEDKAASYTAPVQEAKGTAILDLADETQEAALAAARAEAKAKLEELKARLLESELRVVQQQLDLTQQAADAVSQRMKHIARREKDVQEQLGAQQKAWAGRFEDLKDLFTDLNRQYDQQVSRPLSDAADHMSQAIVIFDPGSHRVPRELKKEVQLDLIAMKLGKVHVLTQHIASHSAYGHTLKVVASGATTLLADAPDADRALIGPDIYQNQADQIVEQQAALVNDAQQLIGKGRELARDLAKRPENDSHSQAAKEYVDLFDIYSQRIEESRLDRVRPVAGVTPVVMHVPVSRSFAAVPIADVTPITGNLPPLPDVAVGDDITGLIWIDGRRLMPAEIQKTAKALLGDKAELITDGLAMFSMYYSQFAQAGGTSVLAAVPSHNKADGEPTEPILFVSLQDGADAKPLVAWLNQLVQQSGQELITQRRGDWLMAHLASTPVPSTGGGARRDMFEQAMAATGPGAVAVVFALDESMLDLVNQAQTMAPTFMPGEPNVSRLRTFIDQTQWIALTIKFGDQLGLYTTTQFTDQASAALAAEVFNNQLAQMLGGGEQLGAMVMLVPMIRSAIQVRHEGRMLRVNLAGPGLRGMAGMVGAIFSSGVGSGGALQGGLELAK